MKRDVYVSCDVKSSMLHAAVEPTYRAKPTRNGSSSSNEGREIVHNQHFGK